MRLMRAAGINAFGDDVRLLEPAAPASPAPDEVMISVHAAGVGDWDEIVRVGSGMSAADHRWYSASRQRESSPQLART